MGFHSSLGLNGGCCSSSQSPGSHIRVQAVKCLTFTVFLFVYVYVCRVKKFSQTLSSLICISSGIIVSLKNPSWPLMGIRLFLTGLRGSEAHLCSFLLFPFLVASWEEFQSITHLKSCSRAHSCRNKREKSSWLSHHLFICIISF